MGFGRRLKMARSFRNFTQGDLANQLSNIEMKSVTYQQIGKYESEERKPRKERLDNLAHSLYMEYRTHPNGEIYFIITNDIDPDKDRVCEFNESQKKDAELSASTDFYQKEESSLRVIRMLVANGDITKEQAINMHEDAEVPLTDIDEMFYETVISFQNMNFSGKEKLSEMAKILATHPHFKLNSKPDDTE